MSRLVISGGQTGVDRAALDAAIALLLPHGGWCPKGRRAEDGRIPDKYRMWESNSDKYPLRTRLNVAMADATVILHEGNMGRGTRLTLKYVIDLQKPHFISIMEPNITDLLRDLVDFLKKAGPIVNFAGPRESTNPGIQQGAFAILREAMRRAHATPWS